MNCYKSRTNHHLKSVMNIDEILTCKLTRTQGRRYRFPKLVSV